MKRKPTLKFVVYILLVAIMLQTCPYAFAHPSSQEGTLAKTYMSQYGGYYIGGEDVGWSIDESFHTNGTTMTYSFSSTDSYLTDTYKAYVTGGASKWSGTVTITNKTDGSGTGLISTYYDSNTYTVAKFCYYAADSSGHLTTWQIQMNRAYTQTATILAHELGHAIGLNDLYNSKNAGKLMYGYTGSTATGPTSSDIWGARVITGVHTTHAWGYKFLEKNSIGNVHIKYCLSCNGLTSYTAQCTYGADLKCTVCGTNMYLPLD